LEVAKKDIVLDNLEAAIRQHPDSTRLYDRLMDSLANRGQLARAAQWCDTLLNRNAGQHVNYWFVRGDLYRNAGLYDSATNSYKRFLTVFPDDEQVLLSLASTLAEAGKSEAIPLCDDMLMRFPTREMKANTSFIKGVYFNSAGKYAQARQWLDTTLLYNYLFSEAYMEKGYSFFDEKNYAEAANTFARLTEVNNGYADGWYWLAKCEEAQGQKQQAHKHYEMAYSLDRKLTEALEAMERLRQAD
jgi:tetratricopeptide (TPR) repeat protein